MAEQAVAERWDLKPFRRDRRAPQSMMSHVLFSLALQLPDSGMSAMPAAVARQGHGDDDGSEKADVGNGPPPVAKR